MSENLFSEFAPVTKEMWKQQVLKELNGKPYDTLVWEKDYLHIEPYYTREDIAGWELPVMKKPQNGWLIRQDFTAADFKNTNQKILRALQNGVDAVGIKFNSPCSSHELEILLDGVYLDMVSVHFMADVHTEKTFEAFVQLAEKRNYNAANLIGSFNTDPLLNSDTPDFFALENLLNKMSVALPQFRLLTIHAQQFQENNNVVDELAFSLYKTHRYFSELGALGYDKYLLANQMQWHVPVGVEYFVEIAKLRAVRILWERLLQEYQIASVPLFIQTQKSWKYNDENDPYKNILRHTTEAMSAVIGGCDMLNLHSTDKHEQFTHDFFERISVNIQHILKHESHFDAVADPAAGSYYIETLTRKLCDAAWAKFNALK